MKKEDVQINDILVNHHYGEVTFAKVIGESTHSFGVLINGDPDSIMFTQLHHWRKLENPIINDRIVCDKTFAVRFKQFLDWIPQSWVWSQPHYEEEFEYMKYVAEVLLKHQIETATDEKEINYLKRLKLL